MKLFTTLFFVLIIIGLVMLSSAGIAEGQKKFGSASYYPIHQVLFGILPGLILFLVFSRIEFEKWQKIALPVLILAIGLLVLVFIPGVGVGVKGAQRWIDVRVATIQPSEFLKFALILYLAAWFARHRTGGSDNSYGRSGVSTIIPFALVLGLVAVLLIIQPDFGTLGIVLLIGIGLYFFSGAKLRHFGILFLVLLVLLGALAIAAPYRFNRIKTFINPQEDKQNTSYHINQALISIGSGGVFGLGYGQGRQKFNYLPEAVGDSIFAIIVEEMGFVGGMVLIGLFTALLLALISIARQTLDPFGRLFVLGVAVWIGGQAFINIAAISGIIPLTGVPLPLISFGSSSLVSIMGAMGIVRNVAKANA